MHIIRMHSVIHTNEYARFVAADHNFLALYTNRNSRCTVAEKRGLGSRCLSVETIESLAIAPGAETSR